MTVSGEPWSFLHSLEWVVNAHPTFNTTGAGIRASVRILGAFEGKAVGDEVKLRKDDKKMLADAFEAPSAGFIPTLERANPDGTKSPITVPGRAFIGYVDAVCGEEKKD